MIIEKQMNLEGQVVIKNFSSLAPQASNSINRSNYKFSQKFMIIIYSL